MCVGLCLWDTPPPGTIYYPLDTRALTTLSPPAQEPPCARKTLSSSRQLAPHNTGTRHFWQHEALHAMASSAMSKPSKAEQCMHVTPSTFLQHCHRAARSWLSPHLLSSSEHVWGSPCGRTLPITHKRRANYIDHAWQIQAQRSETGPSVRDRISPSPPSPQTPEVSTLPSESAEVVVSEVDG